MFKKRKFRKNTYSQCGEDIIIDFALSQMNINNPYYIDIGAHHPYYLSNTAYFYEKGCTGICIEPDPSLFEEIKKYRKKDICLNIGVGINNMTESDFYIINPSTLNTFSKEEAIKYDKSKNHSIEKVIKMPLMKINEIINKYAKLKPNLMSIDIEGLDLQVLKTIDFNTFMPEVICVETLTYTEDTSERKIIEIIDFMRSKNYFVYADTYINTIFIEKNSWNNRK